MNVICTIYLKNQFIGTIISIPSDMQNIESIHDLLAKSISPDKNTNIKFSSQTVLLMTDRGVGTSISCTVSDTEVPDDSLRNLSSNKYIIVTDDKIIRENQVLHLSDKIPSICKWKAIPYVPSKDLVDYVQTNKMDSVFINEGYVRELKQAKYVVIPTDWSYLSEECTPYDLLISDIKDNGFYPLSGRNYTVDEEYDIIDGRYIILENLPSLTEPYTLPPYTYNIESLSAKYTTLQERLEIYGSNRVQSINASLRSLTQRLNDTDNQFMVSEIVYKHVYNLLDKISSIK